MKDVNILFFGDSITYGASDIELGGFVNRVRLYLESNNNRDIRVFNMGIGGETTTEVLKRIEVETKSRFRVNDDTILIFSIGINDTQNINRIDRITIDQFKSNINELINKAKKFTDNIIFIGLTNIDEERLSPTPWNINKSYSNSKVNLFDNTIEERCLKNNIKYIKVNGLLDKLELKDGLHPTSSGHKKLADKLIESLEEML